ncbi:MAG: sugar kinase [Atopobiaceae bacterium]|jgi:2-dehydro-3-deoxygluconokinase|nr:sugar kinase [Atopobiaceae bacterium]MCH4179843.1 sugar kinase [Atopobiaceae bacterium]MCH4213594.1 sugar kinase [Atopobiaceae bacterium]MCH4229599.1 sugar kinase [Atopobiaceae bacterium]MCH4276242.1 sugar kinase [Atopobiaceae bacterium]
MELHGTALTFGEIMMRLSPPDHLRLEQASSFDVHYGGAEANVALSLAYQGDPAAYVSVVPANRIGDCALRSLSTYGVDTSRVVRAGDRLGSYIFELGASVRGNSCVYDRKYSALSLATADVFDWSALLEGISTFYFSGVTAAVSPAMATACEDALEECRARGITTVCDLNYRGKMWTPDEAQATMRRLMPLVDVCVANDEDSASSLGISHGSCSLACGIDEKDAYVEIAHDICEAYGCKAVASVVRNIESVEESTWMGLLYEDGSHWFSPEHHMHVLEGVASGDAFGAGLIHAMSHGFGPQDTIDYAIAASVLKLTIRGDSNLCTADEIAALAGGIGAQRVAR